MARVFLLNPPSPEPVKTPLLSFCHLAASLRASGHEVALLDASAPFAPQDFAQIARLVDAFAPDLVGLHLKTLHVGPAYALVAHLAPHVLVAGGPHATVCPDEPFAMGFHHVIRGEGEHTLCELADALDGKRQLADVASLSFRERGFIRHNPSRGFILDLDELACPTSALDLFAPTWYGATVTLPPAGLLSSRGCPAACNFCSNNVTGRRFRYRSPTSVAHEVALLHERFGLSAFSFFDDSFAVGERRVRELCAALRRGPRVYWTCTAHPAHLSQETLAEMKAAGCGGIDLGMESADPAMLIRIGKGVTVERVSQVLGWCQELGLHSIVNLMFGWPDETDEELGATIGFMERHAGRCNGYNARGVVVPYPGTALYDDHAERFGFARWWLQTPLAYRPFPSTWEPAEIMRAYADDPALARNFFHHPPHRLARIQEALDLKAELTLGQLSRQAPALPAAGAR